MKTQIPLLFSLLVLLVRALYAQDQPTIVNEIQYGGSDINIPHASGITENLISVVVDPI